jgi:4'-phosphopantetheinyl transferase
MPSLAWLQQASRDVPAADDWLSPSELAVLARSAVPKRREEWRLGRWTAKRALLLGGARLFRSLKLPTINGDRSAWPRVEVKAAADGAPEAFLDGARLPLRLSITHRAGLAACLVAPEDVAAGCDMERVEPRDEAFVNDYFTPAERGVVAAAPPESRAETVTLIWSAKESALKALRVGLRADTRDVEVRLLPWQRKDGWTGLAVYDRPHGRLLPGWWRVAGSNVITLITSSPADPPVALM